MATVKTQDRATTANILFDEGAQRSFTTEELAQNLNLEQVKTEMLRLSVFGGSETSTKKVDVATLYLQADNREAIPIQVIVMTADIHALPCLKDLKLCHPVNERKPIYHFLRRRPLLGRCGKPHNPRSRSHWANCHAFTDVRA